MWFLTQLFLKGSRIVRVIPALQQRVFWFLLCFVLVVMLARTRASAQEAASTPASDPMLTHAYLPAAMFAGPGETHDLYGWLDAGLDVTIIERNATGNWVHIVREDREIDAWVLTGYLTLAANLRFSDVPANTDLPDADLDRVPMEPLIAL